LQQLLDISDELAQKLMEYEFSMELNQIFPIVENLNKVKEGDLIVTDTYYSAEQVKCILNKVGLNKKVFVYATASGKNTGNIWNVIKNEHHLLCHLGDNLHSDVSTAESHGIIGVHYTKSSFTPHEQETLDMQERDLAYLMRALRLSNPYPITSIEYALWNEQCRINIPLLITSSLYLHDFCEKHQKKKILFTMRDSCLWIQLFRKLFRQYDSVDFHASRYTYQFPSASYIDYVKNIYNEESVIVDVHGSGRTCEEFFHKHLDKNLTYLSILCPEKKHHAIWRVNELQQEIEKLNYDLSGTLYDVHEGVPCRVAPEYNLDYVQAAHSCMRKCLEVLDHFTFEKFNPGVVQQAYTAMKKSHILDFLNHAKLHLHVPDEENTIHHLHLLQDGRLIVS
jgi:predicted HAD superfamily hydrolase